MTGGASFIGSHLVDKLLYRGSFVKVADDFSSGKLENFEYNLDKERAGFWSADNLTVFKGDLKDKTFTKSVVEYVDVVFHLAALHGGRDIYTLTPLNLVQT